MNDYFMMREVAQEWNVASENLRDSVRIAVKARFRSAIAVPEPLVGIGLVLLYSALIAIWMAL